MCERFGRSKTVGSLLVAALMLGGAREAVAEIVTWEARGTITGMFNPAASFPDSVHLGDAYVLRYSFETNPQYSRVGDGDADYSYAVTAFSYQIGDAISYSVDPSQFVTSLIYVANDQQRSPGTYTDIYALDIFSVSPLGDNSSWGVQLQFANFNQAEPSRLMTGIELSAVPPDLSLVVNGIFRINGGNRVPNSCCDMIYGPVTSLSAVPLPAAGWLLVSGVGGLLALRRRRVEPAR